MAVTMKQEKMKRNTLPRVGGRRPLKEGEIFGRYTPGSHTGGWVDVPR